MSRSGYSDECDVDEQWQLALWRGAVVRSLRGKRGQAFLRELAAAMDAMPEKTLTTGELEADGEFCALGVVGQARGVALAQVDTEDWAQLSKVFGISEAMAREIMWENDESVSGHDWVDVELCGPVRPHYPDYGRHKRSVRVDVKNVGAKRWKYMRDWVAKQLGEGAAP